MKIAIAARLWRQDELTEFVSVLEKRGHEVISTWLKELPDLNTPEDHKRFDAQRVIEIRDANALIAFIPECEIEIGLAIALGTGIFVIGDPASRRFSSLVAGFYQAPEDLLLKGPL